MRVKIKPAFLIGIGFFKTKKYLYQNYAMQKRITITILLPFFLVTIKK